MFEAERILVMALALMGPAPADTPKELQLKPGDQIVAIGDSITQGGGYLRQIDAALAAACPDLKIPKVVNKGIGGQKAEDLTALKQKPAGEKGNWLTGDGVHMKPLGDAVMAAGVLRALGVSDAKLKR